MSHAEPEGVRGPTGATGGFGPTAGSSAGPGLPSPSTAEPVETTGAASGAGAPPEAAPLTSLSALLGDGFEAGSACAADGTCD